MMKDDLIKRSDILGKAIRVHEFDEGGWDRLLRAVPVEDIEAAEAVKIEGDLISRSALQYMYSKECHGECQFCKHARYTGADGKREYGCALINDAPAVDAVSAYWIDRDGKTWCSECGASNKAYKPPFCPHCGAKMDEEGDKP